MDAAAGRRKRALEDTDGRYYASPLAVPPETTSASPRRPLDQLLGLSIAAGDQSGARIERKRIKSRRLAHSQDAERDRGSCARSPRVADDTEAARTPSQALLVSSAKEAAYGSKTSPVCARKRAFSPDGAAAAFASSLGAPERTPRATEPMETQLRVEGGTVLPTLSQLLGPGERDGSVGFARTLLTNRPCGISTITAVNIQVPSIKQGDKDRPVILPQQCGLEPIRRIQTACFDTSAMLPGASDAPQPMCRTEDVSSDEELVGIPEPDTFDQDVSISQERLGELSVTEKDLEESTVFTLCDGLANSLSKDERDRMKLLNLLTIQLAQQSSPILLGRSQFQEVFGDSIRGGTLSCLSRQHCMIHVHEVSSQNDSVKMVVKVRIQDMSTNGIWVNGKQLKHGQTHELQLGDVVTLLRIHRDEDDVSLEYKLVRSILPLQHTTRIRKKSRRDGRCVKPSDTFSGELAELSNRHSLSPVPESVIVLPRSSPARGIVQEIGHHAPACSSTPPRVHPWIMKKIEAGKLSQQVSVLSRHIRCTILCADPSVQYFSESSQPLEDANIDHREELSEVLSAFAQIPTFDASRNHRATTTSIEKALHDDSDVIFYIGGGKENHLIIDAPNGLLACLNKYDLSRLFSGVKSAQPKLIIVIAPSRDPACLLAECGASHVCYLSSASKPFLRVAAFTRALIAGLLKGFDVKKSYIMAEFVALNDLLPIMRPSEQICEMLPLSEQHNVVVGSSSAEPVITDRNMTALLNGQFIPVLSAHFLGRDVIVSQVKSALTQKVRVCNIHGARGVGKSSIAVHIAKICYRTRSYRNGVHYFAVDKLVEHIQNGITPATVDPHRHGFTQLVQREDALDMVMREVESLLRSLPETGHANHPSTLVVLDGCDVVLPALGRVVLKTMRVFPWVQILLTSTEKLQIEADDGGVLSNETIHVKELGRLDCAKLFFKQARGHLTLRQFRQHFSDSSIEALSEDERLLGTKGNPFWISRLVYELESQSAIN